MSDSFHNSALVEVVLSAHPAPTRFPGEQQDEISMQVTLGEKTVALDKTACAEAGNLFMRVANGEFDHLVSPPEPTA